jgi:hypothetical protein
VIGYSDIVSVNVVNAVADVTAPPIPVITTAPATVNSAFYTIVGTAGADTPADTVRTIQVYNGATLAGTATVPVGQTDWSVVVSLTPSAVNSFTATSADVYGNTSAPSAAVLITEDPTAGADVTAPPVPVITTAPATVDADFYTIVGTAGADTPADTVRSIQIYNGATLAGTAVVPVGQTDWSVVVALTQSAGNSFTATSTDAYGNTSAPSAAVLITESPAPVAPAVILTAPAASSTVAGAAVAITATTNAGAPTILAQYQIDGGAWIAYVTPWDTTLVTDGSHTIRVQDTVAGVTGYSDIVSVNVVNAVAAPVEVITLPAASSTVAGAVVAITATTNAGAPTILAQ